MFSLWSSISASRQKERIKLKLLLSAGDFEALAVFCHCFPLPNLHYAIYSFLLIYSGLPMCSISRSMQKL